MFLLSCGPDEIVQYFEYTDHNVLKIGSQLTDLVMTGDSNTLIAVDKGNNQVRFIDVSTDEMSIIKNVWVGSEPTSLDLTADGEDLLVGLQGASSVAVVSVLDMELLGSIQLDDDGVYDIEYINSTDQLIVSFVSSNPAYNKTQIYGWIGISWDDSEGICDAEGTCDINTIDQEACELTAGIWTAFSTKLICEDSGSTWFSDYIVELEAPFSYVNYAGPISISDDEQYIYILDKYNGPPYRVYRYDITAEGLKNKINSSNIADGPVSLHDIEYVPDFGIVVAIGGTDFINNSDLDHSSVYDLNDLNHIANFDVGSTPLAITYDHVGNHIYISPADVDDNGMFIIEYSIQTQLQTNYYQVAGRLGSHALVVDPQGEYLYAAVDDLSDQDTHEPYNGSSFNIQRIKVLPEGSFPINDF